MIRLYFRLCFFLFACAGFWLLWSLPTLYEETPSEELARIPDTDLIAVAETHWKNGFRESAINTLQYALEVDADTNVPSRSGLNTALPQQLLNEYTQTLANEASLDGRLWKMGSGAITGEIDSWEAMAGSTVADLFVVGDIRDLIVQGFIVDDSDELILILSAVGIATTVWPPADPAVSMLKAARKSQSISQPLVDQLIKAGKQFKQAPSAKTQEAFIQTVEPLWQLSGKCRSWSQFKLLLKHSDTLEDVRMLNKVMSHSPKTAAQLNSIFSVCALAGKPMADAMKLIKKGGQAGCDAIYAVLRKGPPGINWLAKHPTLLTRFGKIGYKDSTWAYNQALKEYGKTVLLARFAGLVLCLLIIAYTTPLAFIIKKCLPRSKRAAPVNPLDPIAPKKSIKRHFAVILLVLGFSLSAGAAAALVHGPTLVEKPAQASGVLSAATVGTREIRLHYQEDDSLDPNDHLYQQRIIPIVRSSDARQWLVCSREDLALNWPEFNDGDLSMASIIVSKRGDNPCSALITSEIYLYAPYPLLCLIPCPDAVQSAQVQTPLQVSDLQSQPKLFYVQTRNLLKGISTEKYGIGSSIAIDLDLAPEHKPRLGDYMLRADAALAGIFTGARPLLHLKPDFHLHLIPAIHIGQKAADGYYHRFVQDVLALP